MPPVLQLLLAVLLLITPACDREAPRRRDAHASPSPPPPTRIARPPADAFATTDTTPAGAASVVRAYYHRLAAHDYAGAYALWRGGRAPEARSLDALRRRYAALEDVTVRVGTPSRVEPAAGSRYITVPVEVTQRTADGATRRLTGTYTLRRTVVTGATAEQRLWRLYAAELRPVD